MNDFIRHEIGRIMGLLRIGFMEVCENSEANEAVIMRCAHTELENLVRLHKASTITVMSEDDV